MPLKLIEQQIADSFDKAKKKNVSIYDIWICREVSVLMLTNANWQK